MSAFHRLSIRPRILNTACPWASTLDDLRALYLSPFTGAVTTRTATQGGFPDDPAIHQVAFSSESMSSVNSYGYSPFPLSRYIEWVETILKENLDSNKPVIISITAPLSASTPPSGELLPTPSIDTPPREEATVFDSVTPNGRPRPFPPLSGELLQMINAIQDLRRSLGDMESASPRIAIEINTSCPNIDGHPPPAYEPDTLRPIVNAVADAFAKDATLAVGLKLPPYVHAKQFVDVVDFLASFSKKDVGGERATNPIAFLTCTNTLGTSILFKSQTIIKETGQIDGPRDNDSLLALPTASGGLAGEAIHPLSLGNVHTFSKLLREHQYQALRGIAVIGAGGVVSAAAAERMLQAGASVVGCATILGRDGISVFEALGKAPSLSE